MRCSLVKIIAAITSLALLSAVAYFHDPMENRWSPKCVMLAVTGYRCPGCGMQRFAHSLMHGNIGEAIGHNYFAAVWLPILAAYAVLQSISGGRILSQIKQFASASRVGIAYVVTYFAWWAVRNIINL